MSNQVLEGLVKFSLDYYILQDAWVLTLSMPDVNVPAPQKFDAKTFMSGEEINPSDFNIGIIKYQSWTWASIIKREEMNGSRVEICSPIANGIFPGMDSEKLYVRARDFVHRTKNPLYKKHLDEAQEREDKKIKMCFQSDPQKVVHGSQLHYIMPGLKEIVQHPMVTTVELPLEWIIISLNDRYKWPRDKIADWLETLDVDLSFNVQQ